MLRFFKDILDTAKAGGAKKLAAPCAEKKDMDLLSKAAGSGLIIPCLVGDGKAIEGMLKGMPLASLEHEIMHEKDPDKALGRSIRLVREGRAAILMQGAVDHQMLMDAVMDAGNGLRKWEAYELCFDLSVAETGEAHPRHRHLHQQT